MSGPVDMSDEVTVTIKVPREDAEWYAEWGWRNNAWQTRLREACRAALAERDAPEDAPKRIRWRNKQNGATADFPATVSFSDEWIEEWERVVPEPEPAFVVRTGDRYGDDRYDIKPEPEPPHRPDDRILPRNMTVPEPEPAARPVNPIRFLLLDHANGEVRYLHVDVDGVVRLTEDES